MKFKYLLPIALLASPVMADDFRSFNELTVNNLKQSKEIGSESSYELNSTYFFADQQNNGPLDEFGYLNTDSSIYGLVADNDFSTHYAIGGEAFIGDLIVGGSYAHSEIDFNGGYDSYARTLKLGYLLFDSLILSVENSKTEGYESQTFFSAEYDHGLGGGNYVGTTFTVDDEAENFLLASDYFGKLGHDTYLRAGFEYLYQKEDREPSSDRLGASVAYYFSSFTNVGIKAYERGLYELNAKHYFNKNVALNITHMFHHKELIDERLTTLSLIAQF